MMQRLHTILFLLSAHVSEGSVIVGISKNIGNGSLILGSKMSYFVLYATYLTLIILREKFNSLKNE